MSGRDAARPGPKADPKDVLHTPEIDPNALLAGTDDPSSDKIAKAFEMNARMLQILHQSHERIAKALERGDRTEMVVQSTEALNRTFRRLHESQEELAARLAEERRQKPMVVLLSVLVAGCAIVFLLYFLVDALTLDLRDEVERFAVVREGQDARAAESLDRFEGAGVSLLEAVDRGLATNRVLANESQAGQEALRAERARVTALEDRLKLLEAERDRAQSGSDRFREQNLELAKEVDLLRSKLIKTEIDGGGLQAAIQSVLAGGGATPDASAPEMGGVPVSDTQVGVGVTPGAERLAAATKTTLDLPQAAPPAGSPAALDGSTAAAPDASRSPPPADDAAVDRRAIDMAIAEADKTREAKARELAASEAELRAPTGSEPGRTGSEPVAAADVPLPEVTALNQLLEDAGIIGLRVLRAEAREDDVLARVFVEIRDHGFPIGVHDVAKVHLEVDPVRRSGVLVLRDGVTLVRGERTPIPPGSPLRIELPALAEGSWMNPALLPVVRLVPGEPLAAESDADRPVPLDPPFDPRAALAVLDKILVADGYQEYDFSNLGGVSERDGKLVLIHPQLHVYSSTGTLRRTVEAAECIVDVDPLARVVTLRFVDGHHRTGEREFAFFKGLGDDVGTWAVPLTRADPRRWTDACARLLRLSSP